VGNHHHGFQGIQVFGQAQGIFQKGEATKGMKNFGPKGTHARSFTRRQNHDPEIFWHSATKL
jgi:hypothetical protein